MVEIGGVCIRPSDADTSVIFIHGVLSSGEKAWTNAAGDSWPDLLSKESWPMFSIYNFTYRSDVFCQNYSLVDVVASLREFFNIEGLWQKRRIIFVCHSMGGIAARKFIVSNQARLIENGTEIGLFLVASPSLGSRDANAIAIFSRLVRNSQAEALRFAQNNIWLNELDQEFLTLKDSGRLRIKGKELYEDEPIKIKKWLGFSEQVVEPFSAARYFGEPIKIPYSDHISIAKPADAKELPHKLLVHFIREIFTPPMPKRELPPIEQGEIAIAKKALIALHDGLEGDRPLPREALLAFNHALIETRRYIKHQNSTGERDAAKEQELSDFWIEAASGLWGFDHELASRCMIKGNGWADETVWDDPRYRDLPLKLNDMLERAVQIGGEAARDIIEGECEVDTVTWRTRVMLPPFKSPPEITLSRLGAGVRDEPSIESLTADQFTIVIANTQQAGKWSWRARGTLLH